MGETRLPWWMVLLVGVWVVCLAIWQSSRASREWRWGAGLLSLVYLGLLVVALEGDPRATAGLSGSSRGNQAVDWGLRLGSGAALISAVLLLGRPGPRGQFVWFALLTLANAGVCFASGAATVGWVLLALAAVTAIALAREVRRDGRLLWGELLPADQRLGGDATVQSSWLVGGTGFLLALVLLGTISYAARVETTRATASRRFSALPSPERVRLTLAINSERPRNESLFDWAFDRRSDVVVLLTVLVFVALAMTKPRQRSRSLGVVPMPSDAV